MSGLRSSLALFAAVSEWLHVKRIGEQYQIDLLDPAEGWRLDELRASPLMDDVALIADWRDCGYPAIEVGEKLAASLMGTSTREVPGDLDLPWATFAIRIPPTLLRAVDSAGVAAPIDAVFVRRGPHGVLSISAVGHGDEHVRIHHPAAKMADLVLDPDDVTDTGLRAEHHMELEEVDKRSLVLAARLVVGVLLTFDRPRDARPPAKNSRSASSRRSAEPRLWTFRLVQDVRLDVRDAVRAYVSHGGSSPTVQSLVRGHWRRQPHGPDASRRKWIRVEPYWRGPEDAPIAVRAHRT